MTATTTCPLAIFATVILSTGPQAQSTAPEEVRFELGQGHLIVVSGSIGPLGGRNLLIDTGTIPSVVDTRIARRLRLVSRPSVLVAFGRRVETRSATVDGFHIGSMDSGPVPVGIGDLSYLAGLRIDAIVGLDVLARRSFSVDYGRRRLCFSPREPEQYDVPMELEWPFVAVRVTIDGRAVRLLLDTGSPDAVLFSSGLDPADVARGRPGKVVGYASGPARLRRLGPVRVEIGDQPMPGLAVWALDRSPDGYPPAIAGVLGLRALGSRRVQFDFEHRRLGWSR